MLKQYKLKKVEKVNKKLKKLLPISLPKDFWTKLCVPWKMAEDNLRNMAVDLFNIKVLKLKSHVHYRNLLGYVHHIN